MSPAYPHDKEFPVALTPLAAATRFCPNTGYSIKSGLTLHLRNRWELQGLFKGSYYPPFSLDG